MTGRRVLIVEPGGDAGQAWRAAGGMLASQIEADATNSILELAISARNYYALLAQALRETTGIDIALWQEGIARVAGDEADAQGLQAKVAWQQKQGYTCEWLDESETRARWRWLGSAVGALWASQDGALDPLRLVEALLADARRLGAGVATDRAIRIEQNEGRATGVGCEADQYSAGNVVVAAGAWSSQIQGLPRPIPVKPVRGQMAAVGWPEEMDRAIVYHRDSYILARGSEAILGSTMEDVGYRADVTPEGVASIVSATLRLCPGLMRAKIRRSWAGLRPVTPDGLPIIGPDPDLRGLWYATGHGRNGILLAGLTGRLITGLIDGEDPPGLIRQVGVERFGSAAETG